MADRTDFAGLTRLAPGESLSTDGFSFQDLNPEIIDVLLRIGAVTHRHDAHAALSNPLSNPTVATAASGGTIPSGVEIAVGYTLVDAYGGETALNPVPQSVTTTAGLEIPTAPSVAHEDDAGTLLAGSYVYALTITDGLGGETPLGDAAMLEIQPGSPTNQVVVGGLAAILAASGGDAWRLWRMVDGGPWALLETGTTDAYTDDGTACADASLTPPTSTLGTNSTNTLTVTVPAPQPTGAALYRIYATDAVDFGNPSLLGEYPIAQLGQAKVFTALNFTSGAPPEVSRTTPGAAKINAATDITGLSWKGVVADVASLPSSGNSNGDVRVALSNHTIYVWNSNTSAWSAATGGGSGGGTPELALGDSLTWTDGSGGEVGQITVENDPVLYRIDVQPDVSDPARVVVGDHESTGSLYVESGGPLNAEALSTIPDSATAEDVEVRRNYMLYGQAYNGSTFYSIIDTALRFGVGLMAGDNSVGIFGFIDRENSALALRLRDASGVYIDLATQGVGTWTVPPHNDTGTNNYGHLTLSRTGHHITFTDTRTAGGGPVVTLEADIPEEYRAIFASGTPGNLASPTTFAISDKVSDRRAVSSNPIYMKRLVTVREMNVTTRNLYGGPEKVKLIDSLGRGLLPGYMKEPVADFAALDALASGPIAEWDGFGLMTGEVRVTLDTLESWVFDPDIGWKNLGAGSWKDPVSRSTLSSLSGDMNEARVADGHLYVRYNGKWNRRTGDTTDRNTSSSTTGTLAAGASIERNIFTLLFRAVRIVSVQTNLPARVQIYTTKAKRTADASRPTGTPPPVTAGCGLDVVTTLADPLVHVTPSPTIFNMEAEADADATAILARFTNTDIAPANISYTITYQGI